jgi:5-methylcytosine-specific restriction endonuclease McrA
MDIQQVITGISKFRCDLTGSFELVGRLAEKHGVSVSDLLPIIAMKKGKDKKRGYTKADRQFVFARDNGVCFHCGKEFSLENGDVDHVIPHSLGGITNVTNGVWSCSHCNRSRQNKLFFVV